jgi:hypothetical protein
MYRLSRYRDEWERLTDSASESWSPRVRFSFVEGPFTLHQCGDHASAVPLWPHHHLIYVINRRTEAIATARGKLQCVDRRLGKIQGVFWKRHREIERLKHETALLRQVMAPQRRRGWVWR